MTFSSLFPRQAVVHTTGFTFPTQHILFGITQPLSPSTFPKTQFFFFFETLRASSSPDGHNNRFQIRTIHFLLMKEDSHLPYSGPREFLTRFAFARQPWRSSWWVHFASFPPLAVRFSGFSLRWVFSDPLPVSQPPVKSQHFKETETIDN